MTDWNLAAKIFFGIAAGCVVLIALIVMVKSRPLWSFVAWVVKTTVKGFGSALFAILEILMYTVLIGIIVSLIVIVLAIPIAAFGWLDYPPGLLGIFPWIGLGYLYRKIKKMEEEQSLRRDDQSNHFNQPPNHSPH